MTTRKQKQIWQDEHTRMSTLPGMANIEPASGVLKFTDWLKANGKLHSGNAVDIGAGKGRNSVHLAKIGYRVWALEYIQAAINASKELASANNVEKLINFNLVEFDKSWPIEDSFFDIAVDSFSSIDVETKSGRETYREELYRTLKPGGFALVTVVSAEDEWESEMIANNPGPEKNSTIWPKTGKFQKNYTKDELMEFYRKFRILELETLSSPAYKMGRHGTATNFWLLLQK